MDITIIVVLLLLGVIFMLVELFFLPGFSIAGIAGFLFIGGAVAYAYSSIGSTAGHITLAGGVVFVGISIWIFVRSKTLDKMSLKTDIDGKIEPLKGFDIKEGDKGITISRLAPMGKARINGNIVEAKTSDDFIDENENIVVIKVYNTNVLVDRDNSEKNNDKE